MEKEIVYKEESYQIISCCMEVYNVLGNGFLETVYKEALEYEFKKRNIPYIKEKIFTIPYKEIILIKKFQADFEVYGKIILEVKAISELIEKNKSQTLNYLKATKYKLGILVNFWEERFKYRRLVL